VSKREENQQEPFHPQITKKAREVSRTKPVGEALYEEAFVRQQKQKEKLEMSK